MGEGCVCGGGEGGWHLCVHFLKTPANEELQDGDDISLVGGHSAPEALDLMGEGPSMLECDVIHAFQQRLTPISCIQNLPSLSRDSSPLTM
jgi:hypothetical protein